MAAATRLLRGFDARFTSDRDGGETRFAIENPRELTFEEHPWAIDLAVWLQREGIEPVSFRGR
ncbi:MAG: hypothetical protein M3O84_03135 [Actinomycetota bacterium]|nr:hypothetical protein [Actinomycetota bacterium]